MLLDLGSPVGGRPSAARHSALEGARLDVHFCLVEGWQGHGTPSPEEGILLEAFKGASFSKEVALRAQCRREY